MTNLTSWFLIKNKVLRRPGARFAVFSFTLGGGEKVSESLVITQNKFIKDNVNAISAGIENGLIPNPSQDGFIKVRLIREDNHPITGPMIKPNPNATPTNAMPLDRSFSLVTSATAAVATARFPPMIPPKTRARTKRLNELAKTHRR